MVATMALHRRLLSAQIPQSTRPVFEVMGAENHAFVEFISIDDEDVEAAAAIAISSERFCVS